MSGFTIDIQLTELGFPDLFQNGDTPNKTSSATPSDNSSCTLKTHPNSQTSSPSFLCIHNSLTNNDPSPITCNYTNALPANNFPLKPVQGSDSLPDPGSNTDHDSDERLQIIDPKDVTGHKSKPSQSSSMVLKLVSKPKTVLVKRKGPHKPHNGYKKQKGRGPKKDYGAIEMEMDSAETDNSDASEEDEDEEAETAVSGVVFCASSWKFYFCLFPFLHRFTADSLL